MRKRAERQTESGRNHTLSIALLKVNLKSTAKVSVKARLEDKTSPSILFAKGILPLMEVKLQLLKQNYRKCHLWRVSKLLLLYGRLVTVYGIFSFL